MTQEIQSAKFESKISQFEKELELIYKENLEKFPNHPQEQAKSFLANLAKKIQAFSESISKEDQPAFQEYMKQELNLKDSKDIQNFVSSAPNEMKNLVDKAFLTGNGVN